MLLRRTIAALSLLWAVLSPLAAIAQAPPAVPALPDSERRTAYSITASTCVCAVNMALYGDGTDVDEWLQVWVGGARYLSTDPNFGWSLSSATGSLATIPRPITDAVLTFNNAQTATIQIVGARRPRQLSQFTEGRGVAARDLNQRLTDITAIERELWDKTSDLSGRGLFFQPGTTTGPMPQPSACQNSYLAFDSTGENPVCMPGPTGSGGNVAGPATSTIGHVAEWNNATGTLLKDGGTVLTGPGSSTNNAIATWNGTGGSALFSSPDTINSAGTLGINPTPNSYSAGFQITQSSPTSGSQAGPFSYNKITINDQSNITGAAGTIQTSGLRIDMTVGGANLGGQPKIGAYFNLIESIAGVTNATDKIAFVGSCLIQIVEASTGAGCYGGNVTASVQSSGSIARLVGMECDINIASGSAATNRYCYSAVNNGAAQGSTLDAAFFVANITGSGGAFKSLIALSNGLGFAPMATTANLIYSDTAFTINDVFHMANATVNGNILGFANATLTGSGALTLLGSVPTPTGNGQGSFGASSTSGVSIIGQGSADDFGLFNNAGTNVCVVPTGTRTLNCNTFNVTTNYQVGGTQIATTNLGDTTAGTTWTPNDQSGGGLTFTAVATGVTKIGNLVWIYGTITWPSTADSHAVTIGGMPYTVANQNYAQNAGVSANNAGLGIVEQGIKNTQTFALIGNGTLTPVTNANMSGKILNFSFFYTTL